MIRTGPRHVAIWIDLQQAILLAFEAEPSGTSTLPGQAESWSQDRVDARQYPGKRQYYGAVLSHLEPLDEILILGPGRARRELRRQIEWREGLKGKVVGLYRTSTLSEVDVVFPTSETWRTEKLGRAQADTPVPRPTPMLTERLGAV